MKYMMMMNVAGGPYRITDWPREAFQAHIAFMQRFAQKLSAAGELVGAEGLSGPDQAQLVRAGDKGQPVTDGVFPEAKEFLAGFWIIDVEGPERQPPRTQLPPRPRPPSDPEARGLRPSSLVSYSFPWKT